MKELYLDIMEKAFSAYSPERITAYINEVREKGLTEHGFPRVGSNIGILMAYGRRLDLKPQFIEIVDICCAEFPTCYNKPDHTGANFSVREICSAIMELEKTDVIEKELLAKWKKQLSEIDPWKVYNNVASENLKTPANWACFGALSEQVRCLLCDIDSTAFIENQLPSQLLRLDSNGMYRDKPEIFGPKQPITYDIATRLLLGLSLYLGYNGKYASAIEKMMADSDELTLKMQSVTGELPFGGRSNQFIFTETVLASYCELRATLLYKAGDLEKAGRFKAAAEKATKDALWWLDQKPMSHVKNHFDPDSLLGCEFYAYFNKYMITTASDVYFAFLVANDEIKPTVAVSDIGGYIAETSEDFHKVFMNAGGYFIQLDTNADTHYDAGGLGRVHKKNCDSRVCLSVPFPYGETKYKLEAPNKHPLSICCYKNTADGIFCSAEDGLKHLLVSKSEGSDKCSATFNCILDGEGLFTEKYTVSSAGVDIEFCGADGILVPAFLFDGAKETEIAESDGQIVIKYNGSFCKYTFNGKATEYGNFFNRNGRYRAYKIETDKLHIEMGDINEL